MDSPEFQRTGLWGRASSLPRRASIDASVLCVEPNTSSSRERNAGIWRLSWAVASRATWVSLPERKKIFGEGGIMQQLLGTRDSGEAGDE